MKQQISTPANQHSRFISRRFISTLVMLLAAFVGTALTTNHASAQEKQTHMVAMRDGTLLATDVYLPADAELPVPAILMRGPYGKNRSGGRFAPGVLNRGYALVAQDLRGRFESPGSDAVIFHNDGWSERRDGHDTLEWIAAQTWCNGSVATTGGSALGITQNMMAPGAPESLKAQSVSVAFSDMYTQGAYQGGVWRKALIETWLTMNRFDPESLESFRAHPRYDTFWDALNAEAQADRVHSPAIFVGGWYDIFLQGTINSFTTIQSQGLSGARGNCRLIIGPWAHGSFNQLKYPANAAQRPAAAEPFRFFDYHLKGEKNGVEDDLPVHYYVMGDPTDDDAPGNYWRSAKSWPPPSKQVPFYLLEDRRLARTKPADDAAISFKFDPDNPVPTIGGQNLTIPKGPMDQTSVESRPDVLLFTTPVLTEPLEVTGRITARLFVSSDCPDTDFTVKLCDVYPDGRSMLVTDGILRAKYRESFREPQLLQRDEVYRLDVDLWSTSLVFNAEHKIRIAVSSSNSPRFEPNSNTGKDPMADGKTRVATNTIHLSQEYPSHVILPVFDLPHAQADSQ